MRRGTQRPAPGAVPQPSDRSSTLPSRPRPHRPRPRVPCYRPAAAVSPLPKAPPSALSLAHRAAVQGYKTHSSPLQAASFNPASMRSRTAPLHDQSRATSQNPPDSRIAAGLIQVGAEDRAMASAVRLREDYSAAELRALARRSKTVNQSRRLLSLAAVRDGMDRGSAAKIGGMGRPTLHDLGQPLHLSGPASTLHTQDGRPQP